MSVFTRYLPLDQFILIHGPNIPSFYAILFFTALDFTFSTRPIHILALFPLWPSPFILYRAVPLLFPSSTLDICQRGELTFWCHVFLPFHIFLGVLEATVLKWFALPSPVGLVLSGRSTIIHLSWVVLHGMAHGFIELHKAVIHVIILVIYLWLSFLF